MKNRYTIDADSDYKINIIIDDYDEIFRFEFTQLSYCCGVFEIGEISLFDRTITIRNEEFVKTLTKAITDFYKIHKIKRGAGGRKIIVNIIDNSACKIFEHCLLKSGVFKEIARFKNSNSGNQVRMYLSI